MGSIQNEIRSDDVNDLAEQVKVTREQRQTKGEKVDQRRGIPEILDAVGVL
jgi:hypothetical protein